MKKIQNCTANETTIIHKNDYKEYPNFGVFPLHQIAHVGVSPSRGLKLFGCVIIFEVLQPMSQMSQTDR